MMSTTINANETTPVAGDSLLAEGLDLAADQLEALYSVGFTYYQQKRYADAHPVLQLVALCNLGNQRYWHALAACRQMMGDYLLAAETYVVAAGCDVTDAESAVMAAFCLVRVSDFPAATVWLDEAERRIVDDAPGKRHAAICRQLRAALQRRTNQS